MGSKNLFPACLLAALSFAAPPPALLSEEFLSHPPMQPLPSPSQRPLAAGPGFFVDARDGSDAAEGSRARPWKTIHHALSQMQHGDTLYLRGGTYYEQVVVPNSGDEGKPITIRSFPGELAVIDGGLREFFEHPETAWQPLPEGAEHEYVSTGTYPAFSERPILNAFLSAGWEPFHGKEDQRPVVLGNFGDSMVPLHGYRTLADLRDDSMLWDVDNKFDKAEGVYCGPGVWFNRNSQRIHIRLAPTNLPGLAEQNYRGVTDPRRLPLVISGPYGRDVLRINGIGHLVLQDLVLRGAASSPLLNIYGSHDIKLDGVTVYGGSPGLLVKSTTKLEIANSAFRSLAAPWSSRASMKYRGVPSYAIITQRNKPENEDFDFHHSEFTDGHDFAWLRYAKNIRFHHNLMENFNDDGLEVGAKKRDHEIYIYQNLLRRCLITFTLHEMEADESPPEVDPGSGVYITRNVIDLRQGVFKTPPREPDPSGSYLNQSGTLCSDHGGPTWPHYYFYHNTVVRADRAWRGYYGLGMGGRGLARTKRRVLNNVFLQIKGLPGLNFVPNYGDVLVDGNLHWGVKDGPGYAGDFFEQQGRAYAFRKKEYPAGWMEHDQFADPAVVAIGPAVADAIDLRLQENSPAIDSGVSLPGQWMDPVRELDQGKPDRGAIPFQVQPWHVGIDGRITLFGQRD